MKKMINVVKHFFLTILACIIAILCGICFVFMLPLDYIKYKRSPYYKKERKKYRLFAASGCAFEIYNEILKNNLPIRFFANPKEASLESGWFVFGDILIIPNVFSFDFDSESQRWLYCDEDDEEKRTIMALDEYIEIEIREANELAGRVICTDAIVLIDADCIENMDMAKKEKRFLIYEDNRAEVLRQFCEQA